MLTSSSVPFSVAWGLYGQTAYQRIRIPAATPSPDTTDQKPGYLCWGDAGTLPTPTPAVGPNFAMGTDETHTELSRVTTLVRIENPDDPSQYIMVDRTRQATFQKSGGPPIPWSGSNMTAASKFSGDPPRPPDPPGTSGYFIPTPEAIAADKKGLKVIFMDPPGTSGYFIPYPTPTP